MAGISAVSGILLLASLVTTVDLALFTNVGIGSWLLLLAITIATSPLTVRVTSTDGILRSRESIADSFVLLAVMLYAVPPSNTAGPAVLLAALVAFVSTYRIATNREVLLKTGMAVVSTFVAASFYGILVKLLAEPEHFAAEFLVQPPGVRQLQRANAAIDQLDVQLPLQLLQMLAGGRLTHRVQLGGPADAARLGDIPKELEVIQVHPHRLLLV